MSNPTETSPASRNDWELAIRRARLGTVIPARKGKDGQTTKGGISGTLFTGIALGWSSYADPDGTRVRPGDATVAVDLETSIAAVRAVRQALLDLGLLEPVASRRGGYGIEYRLTLPADLEARVEVLTSDQHRSEAGRLRDAARGKSAPGYPSGQPEMGIPVDNPDGSLGIPVDNPSNADAGYPSGTPETGSGWSSGTSLGSPVDTHTKERPITTSLKEMCDEPAADNGPGPPPDLFGEGLSSPTPKSAKSGKIPSTHPKLAWTPDEIDADPKFREFWEAYPSIKGKGRGRTAWLKALRGGASPDALIAGALAYRRDPLRTAQYTKHASTWLNDECWGDYDQPVAAGVAERAGDNHRSGGTGRYAPFRNPDPSAYDLPL